MTGPIRGTAAIFLAQGGLFHKRLDPAICDGNLFLECVQLLEQHPHQRLAETCEFTFALFKDVGHGMLESRWRLRNRDSALAEQSSGLVDECRALVDQQLTTRCTAFMSCCSTGLTGSNFMLGRDAASTMASASWRSFLFVLTNGVTK